MASSMVLAVCAWQPGVAAASGCSRATCLGSSFFSGQATDPGRTASPYSLVPVARDAQCSAATAGERPYFVRDRAVAVRSCTGPVCTPSECCTTTICPHGHSTAFCSQPAPAPGLPAMAGTQTCGSSVFVSAAKQQAQAPDTLCRDADAARPYFDPDRFDHVCPGLTCTSDDCCHARPDTDGTGPLAGQLATLASVSTIALSAARQLDARV